MPKPLTKKQMKRALKKARREAERARKAALKAAKKGKRAKSREEEVPDRCTPSPSNWKWTSWPWSTCKSYLVPL